MGGFLVSKKYRPVLGPGSYVSISGGGPAYSAAVLVMLDILDEMAPNRVRGKKAYLQGHTEAMGK